MITLKNVLVTVVVAAAVALGVAFAVAAQKGTDVLGGISNVQQVLWQFTAGISLDPGSSNGGAGSVIMTKSGTMGPGVNQVGWTNKTGKTVFVDYSDATLTGFASTSMRLSVFATSTAPGSIANNFAAPANSTTTMSNLLIDNFLIPTSTPTNYVVNSDTGQTGNATGTVAVPDGQSIVIMLRQDRTGACTGATCETATSTNRGFNLNWFIAAHYRP